MTVCIILNNGVVVNVYFVAFFFFQSHFPGILPCMCSTLCAHVTQHAPHCSTPFFGMPKLITLPNLFFFFLPPLASLFWRLSLSLSLVVTGVQSRVLRFGKLMYLYSSCQELPAARG